MSGQLQLARTLKLDPDYVGGGTFALRQKLPRHPIKADPAAVLADAAAGLAPRYNV